jgi:membrane protease subunit HflK
MTRGRIVFVLAVLAYLATGIAPIGPDERGIVRRFGQIVARPGPGLWVGLPWGMDRVDRIRVKTVRQFPVGEGDAYSLTGDQNLVRAGLVIEYVVDERPAGLDDFLIHQDRVDAVLLREVEAATSEWASARAVDDVLLGGRVTLAAYLGRCMPERIQPHRLGIVVQRVSIDSMSPPDDVREAFEQVNQAQSAMATRENQARQDADRRLREAESVRFRFETQAEAYRRQSESLARADAGAFIQRLAQYQAVRATNPDILSAIWWDETGRILLGMKGRGRIDLLDSHIGKDGLDISQFLPQKK